MSLPKNPRQLILPIAVLLLLVLNSCKTPVLSENSRRFAETSWKESTEPIHPGIPGETPFWNEKAFRFIYAPAFNFKKISQAVKYRFEITSLKSDEKFSFTGSEPHAPLSLVWAKIPVGYFDLTVLGISSSGEILGRAGSGKYYRAAPFNGPYQEPVLPYSVSAQVALDSIMNKDYVKYWHTYKKPDPTYLNYRFPAKIISSLIVGAITQAKLESKTKDKAHAIELARIIADYLLSIRYEKGSAWEYFVPSYSKEIVSGNKPYMTHANNFTIIGADPGNAFLDLYDYTGDRKYFEAAKQIADTYAKTQLANGTWHQLVDYKSSKPVAPNLAIPTSVVNYFNRFKQDYKIDDYEQSLNAALKWIMDNPARTFNWQGQYEDISPRKPYENQNREQACDLAIYLFKNNKNLQLAEDLVRFAEDQFIIWEQPMDTMIRKTENPGYNPLNWILPSVQEQYAYWMPVGRAAGIMVETYWHAYYATKNEIYLEKAKSIANAFTVMQKAHDGNYSTYFTKYPIELWLNSTVYPSKVLMNLEDRINKLETKRSK